MKTYPIIAMALMLSLANEITAQSEQSTDLTFKSTQLSCFGKNDGTIIIANANPARNYVHQAINALTNDPVLAEYKPDNAIINLPPGDYRVLSQYSEADGSLKQFKSKGIKVQDAQKLDAKEPIILTKPNNQVPNNGMVFIEISGGSEPYQIEQISPTETIQRGPYTPRAQLNNLRNDSYTFNITDKNACPVVTKTILIPKDNGLIVNPRFTQPTCATANGRIDFSFSGGTPPYTVSCKSVATGAVTSKVFNSDGNGSIELEGDVKYSVEITDNGVPQKSEKNISADFTRPNCNLTITVSPATSPTVSNTQGGKVDVTVVNGMRDYRISLVKDNGETKKDTKSFDDFSINNLTKGDYTIWIEDSRGATGFKSFKISTAIQSADESKAAAKAEYKRFINKYCQIEIKRRQVKAAKKWLALGWTVLSGTSSLLTSGAIQIATIGLNVAGNTILTFTNNDNYEALTRASEIMKAKLDVDFLELPYYVGWDDTKYQALMNELADLRQVDKAVSKMDNLPELKNYSEKKKIKKVPEYTKYQTD